MAAETISLDILNNDVLLEVIDHLDDATVIIHQPGRRDLPRNPDLKNLSMTSHRFRALVAPTLFRTVKIVGSWSQVVAGAKVLENSSTMLKSAK